MRFDPWGDCEILHRLGPMQQLTMGRLASSVWSQWVFIETHKQGYYYCFVSTMTAFWDLHGFTLFEGNPEIHLGFFSETELKFVQRVLLFT